jgi:hypothetical protein
MYPRHKRPLCGFQCYQACRYCKSILRVSKPFSQAYTDAGHLAEG